MKILFWTDFFWPKIGGMETQATVLLHALQRRGHQCVVITRQTQTTLVNYQEHRSIPIYRYPFDQAYEQKDLKLTGHIFCQTKKFILQFKPDVIHVNIGFGPALTIYQMLNKTISIPSLVTIHGLATDEKPQFVKVYKQIFAMGDRLSCVSQAILKEVRHYNPDIRDKSCCIYNGLPMPSLEPLVPNFTPSKILLIGRFIERKGFDLAIHAVRLLVNKISEVQLNIAGYGSDEMHLKQLAKNLKLEKNTTFLGAVNQHNALALINEASIVVIPSRYESFGLVALEAMQLAKPIIASRAGGLPEIVRHQDTGLLVEKNNIEQIASAMEYLITHPDEAVAMGQRARADVLVRFSIEKITDDYEQAYRDVIQLRKKNGALSAPYQVPLKEKRET